MRVKVKMFGSLRRLLPVDEDSLVLDLPDGATVAHILCRLEVPDGELGLAVVDGVVEADTTILRDGDLVELFAVMAGGVAAGVGKAQTA